MSWIGQCFFIARRWSFHDVGHQAILATWSMLLFTYVHADYHFNFLAKFEYFLRHSVRAKARICVLLSTFAFIPVMSFYLTGNQRQHMKDIANWQAVLANWRYFYLIFLTLIASVLWRCWLGVRKSIRPVKHWVMWCLCGYRSAGVRWKWFAYGPATVIM